MKPVADITGGNVLRIPALRSPNFAPATAGWTINQDGSAQFNNVTVIGSIVLTNSETILIYSSATPAAGKLIISISPVAGSDSFGNSYPAGLAFYDASENQIATLDPVNGLILNGYGGAQTVSLTDVPIYVQTVSGTQPNLAANLSAVSGLIFTAIPALRIMGPTMPVATDSKTSRASIVMTGGNAADAAEGLLQFESTDSGGVLTVLTWTKNNVTVALPLIVDGQLSVANSAQGAITVTGSINGQQLVRAIGNDTTTVAYEAEVTGDTLRRWVLRADGTQEWGSGTAGRDVTLQRTAAGILGLSAGSFAVTTIGQGLQVKEGTNAKMGTAVLVGGTVTVNNSSVTANSRIFVTAQNTGGVPGAVRISARTAGTSFTITSNVATDTSTVAWLMLEPA